MHGDRSSQCRTLVHLPEELGRAPTFSRPARSSEAIWVRLRVSAIRPRRREGSLKTPIERPDRASSGAAGEACSWGRRDRLWRACSSATCVARGLRSKGQSTRFFARYSLWSRPLGGFFCVPRKVETVRCGGRVHSRWRRYPCQLKPRWRPVRWSGAEGLCFQSGVKWILRPSGGTAVSAIAEDASGPS